MKNSERKQKMRLAGPSNASFHFNSQSKSINQSIRESTRQDVPWHRESSTDGILLYVLQSTSTPQNPIYSHKRPNRGHN